jgi:hypothetical protein
VILVPELALSNQAAMVAIHSSLMSKQDAKEPQKETAGSKAK